MSDPTRMAVICAFGIAFSMLLNGGAEAAAIDTTPSKKSIPMVHAVMDPKAVALVDRMKTALANLSSYSATVVHTRTFSSHGETLPTEESHWSFAFQRPNFLKFVLTPSGGTQVVSDGSRLHVEILNGSSLANNIPSPASLEGVLLNVGEEVPDFLELGGLFDRDDLPLLKNRDPLQSLVTEPAAQMNGEPVDIVTATWRLDSKAREVVSIAMGHEDHLPRRAVFSFVDSSGSMSVTVSLSNIQVNPKLDRSLFTTQPLPPPFDPKAEALLAQIRAAYSHIHSLSATLQVRALTLDPNIPGFQMLVNGISIFEIAKPNLLSAKTVIGKETIKTVWDGKYTYSCKSSQPASYEKRAAPRGFEELGTPVGGTNLLLSNAESLLKKGDPMGLNSLRRACGSLRLGGTGEIDGIPVETLVMQSKGPSAPAEIGTYEITMGKRDHLIRRFTIHDLVPMIQSAVTFSDIRVNPSLPSSTFKFVPPPGSKPVGSKPLGAGAR